MRMQARPTRLKLLKQSSSIRDRQRLLNLVLGHSRSFSFLPFFYDQFIVSNFETYFYGDGVVIFEGEPAVFR